jgi:restriction system protein
MKSQPMSDSPIYVPRPAMLEKIHNSLQRNGIVILQGPKGCGKTMLIRDYINQFRNHYFELFHFNYYEIPVLENLRKVSWRDQGNRNLLIIDGYDEILFRKDKELILQSIKSYQRSGMQLLVTTSTDEDLQSLLPLAQKIYVEKFSPDEIKELISQARYISQISDNELYILLQQIQNTRGYPSDILNIFHLFDYHRNTGEPLENLLRNSLIYENKIIATPGLITDVRVINDFLWDKIKKDPKVLYSIHPRKFEEIVADMFSKMGYTVELTPPTRDGGKDMYLLEHSKFGKLLYLVECKRNAPDNPVGVGVISNLYGRVNHERANAGVVVTTSTFSKPAKDFKETVQYQINLVDYGNLCSLINSIK